MLITKVLTVTIPIVFPDKILERYCLKTQHIANMKNIREVLSQTPYISSAIGHENNEI